MARTRATKAFDMHNMVPGPAASAVVQVIYKTEEGILICYGLSAISVLQGEAANTYAPGCIFIRSLAAGTSVAYINVGASDAVANFEVIASS
ncbi:hypothetical protein LCGC14_1338840 [marine sediment metagenome]|uniref:Uncharacterized protein n=1 Tax=marine sediment metagenome TaxID=412755 RepID=A0A0F9KE40_9ZZZZ